MDARVLAGIDLYGRTLRYAEVECYDVEHHGTRHRLLRLGSCDFEFDVTRVLWSAPADQQQQSHQQQLETLGKALADVYESTSAGELRVVVHPPQAYSFFAPAPARAARAARLEHFAREAQLLADGDAADGSGSVRGNGPSGARDGLHVTADECYAERGVNGRRAWFHVLALSGEAHARFRRVMHTLPLPDFRWTISMEGAARAAVLLEHRRRERSLQKEPSQSGGAEPWGAGAASAEHARTEEAPFRLTVGCYAEHLELALARHGQFHFALHAPHAEPPDSAYFAAALLERLGLAPPSVGQTFVYGLDADAASDDFTALGRLTETIPEPLDFRPIVGLDPEHLAEDFDPGPYVPCVGAAL
jgi:hypothetical protein